ncbi:MAG: electron transfer flavoprotein subunit alpha [Desulfobacterales bacterium]|nr:electron transfer flavoprotein subunit alpha [Desulfobacterales bacterium]
MSILIDEDKCTGCRRCLSACPYDALELDDKRAVVTPGCTNCGACLESCKFEAISFDGPADRIKMDVTGFEGIYVFIETTENRVSRGSLEILGKAGELAREAHRSGKECRVAAILIGHQVGALADELIHFGADHVILIDDERFRTYRTDYYTKAVAEVVRKKMPEILLLGATPLGRDLAPRIANRLKTGLTADCTRLSLCEKEGILLQTRPAFGGNIMATIVCPDNRPQMATVRPGVMKKQDPDRARQGTREKMEVSLTKKDDLVRVKEIIGHQGESLDLEDARIIVAGGRGVKGAEGFKLLEGLAGALGAKIGATRAAVEAGWISQDHQVGQTGKTIRPDLYIACGVSGSIQHMAGVMGAARIIAINKDKNAPITDMADVSYVGDLFQVIPDLTRKIKDHRGALKAS